MAQDIEYGFCQCGCGERTTIHNGHPRRYIHNHHTRLSPVEYVEQDCGYKTPCWIWQRSINADGYGSGGTRMNHRHAHQLYYERLVGPVPDGLELDHLCGQRACCNPAHLEPATHIENVRRGGVAHLTAVYVSQIKEWLNCKGLAQSTIAKMYGVSNSAINHIHRGRTWGDVR